MKILKIKPYFSNKRIKKPMLIIKNLQKIFLVGLFSCLFYVGKAQIRKYSNDFLSIGVGAKGLGMGNSVVASSNDVTSAYWNPAGLVDIKSNVQLGAMHAEYFGSISNLDYAGIAFKLDTSSSLGINMIRFGIDNIPNTIDLVQPDGSINYNNITTFSASDYAFLFSYARKLKNPNISVGANAKIIHRRVGNMAQAWGFGLDAGFRYRWKNFTYAVMARDITTTINAWTFNLSDRIKEVWALTGNEIPENSTEITAPRIIFAANYIFTINNKFYIQPEVNIHITTDGKRNVLIPGDPISVDPMAGIETSFKNIVFLRAGVTNIQKEKNDIGNRSFTTVLPTTGIGFKYKQISIDYAYTDIGDQSAMLFSHIFSLKFDIYKQSK